MRCALNGMAVFLILTGCQRSAPGPVAEAPPRELPGLHNVLNVNDRLISGSMPEGEAGFHSLRELGVRTVISVDGTKPDLELARQAGLRYVHLPIGYDGVPRDQALRIARAVHDLPGPVYIHCHHGKHRGPAAAAAAALCLNSAMTPGEAVRLLKSAGTDPHYQGLYESVENLRRPTEEEWERVSGDFPEVAKVPALAEFMVGLDERWDRVLLIRAAGWQVPAEHADLDPPHELLQVREQFREASRLPDVSRRPAEMQRLLHAAETTAAELEAALRPARRYRGGGAHLRSAQGIVQELPRAISRSAGSQPITYRPTIMAQALRKASGKP